MPNSRSPWNRSIIELELTNFFFTQIEFVRFFQIAKYLIFLLKNGLEPNPVRIMTLFLSLSKLINFLNIF